MKRDEMTGLLNRATYVERVSSCFGQTREVNHALVMVDVDQFKQFNDNWRHQFGDRVLADVATSIQKCLRRGDLFGRMGGDEFSIFMHNFPSLDVARQRLRSCAAPRP